MKNNIIKRRKFEQVVATTRTSPRTDDNNVD